MIPSPLDIDALWPSGMPAGESKSPEPPFSKRGILYGSLKMRFGIVVFPGTWSDTDCHHAVSEVLRQDAEYVLAPAGQPGGPTIA